MPPAPLVSTAIVSSRRWLMMPLRGADTGFCSVLQPVPSGHGYHYHDVYDFQQVHDHHEAHDHHNDHVSPFMIISACRQLIDHSCRHAERSAVPRPAPRRFLSLPRPSLGTLSIFPKTGAELTFLSQLCQDQWPEVLFERCRLRCGRRERLLACATGRNCRYQYSLLRYRQHGRHYRAYLVSAKDVRLAPWRS